MNLPLDSNFRAPAPRSPAPRIDPVFLWPTPNENDFLFYVERNGDLPANKIWEYGSSYFDPIKYPNHKLVYVAPQSPDKWSKWYYAAEREHQDEYNWSTAIADIGGTKFDSVSREYVVLRDSFDPASPLMGATMPDIPEGKFAGVFVLSERQEIPTPDQELNSIFVFEKRTYIDKQPLIDIEINRETGETQQIITNYYYRGEIVNGSAIETLVADETNAYWDLDENGFGNVARQLSDNWWEVSQRQWINLADIWEWELDRRGPLKFYCPSDETSLTETTTGNAPGPLSPLPDVEVGQMVKILKWGGYMRYTTVSRNNAGLRVINELGYLPDDGYSYPVQNELVEDSEVPDDRVEADATGRVVEYEGIEGCLAVKTERQGLSLEAETEEVSSRLKPQKYITGGSVTSSETQTATDGSLSMETATEGQENVFTQKGVIAKLKTITQEGDLTPLEGAEVNPQDGIGYETLEEAVPYDEVTPTNMDADGNVTEYVPIDGNFAKKTVRNILSTETETQEISSFLRPEKYIPGISILSSQTEIATDGSLAMASAAEGEQVEFESKGNISKLKTTTQEAEVIPLAGAEVNPQDGIGYETLEEAVPYDEVTPTSMDADGNVTEYVPIDGNFARKVVKNVLSVEEETQKVSNRLPPDKFFEGGGKPKTTIEIVVGDVPADLACGLDESVQRTSKGLIHQTKTTTFEGDSVKLPSTSFDQRTGIGYLEDQEVVPLDEVTETSVDEDGKVAVFEPYNADYAIKTTKRVASPETKTWTDIVNYEWPPVLEDLYIKTYQKRNGTVLSVPVIKYRSAFTGPQEVGVTQYWQKEPHVPVSPQQMLPEGFRFQCMYFTVDMPPCLHDTVNFAVSTGTNDPVWENYSETDSFPATNHITWPASITWSESKPYMGGYLVTEWVINRPE
jgi:hypothetical protein